MARLLWDPGRLTSPDIDLVSALSSLAIASSFPEDLVADVDVPTPIPPIFPNFLGWLGASIHAWSAVVMRGIPLPPVVMRGIPLPLPFRHRLYPVVERGSPPSSYFGVDRAGEGLVTPRMVATRCRPTHRCVGAMEVVHPRR